METALSRDLNSVRAEFENWRTQRKSRERIPENLWAAAISMLDYYPITKVSRELKLNLKQLKKRSKHNGKVERQNHKSKKAFLEVSAGDLVKTLPLSQNAEVSNASETTCRIVFERSDGSRLSLSLPLECNLIESICFNFLRA
jgi:hypothetical protein